MKYMSYRPRMYSFQSEIAEVAKEARLAEETQEIRERTKLGK